MVIVDESTRDMIYHIAKYVKKWNSTDLMKVSQTTTWTKLMRGLILDKWEPLMEEAHKYHDVEAFALLSCLGFPKFLKLGLDYVPGDSPRKELAQQIKAFFVKENVRNPCYEDISYFDIITKG